MIAWQIAQIPNRSWEKFPSNRPTVVSLSILFSQKISYIENSWEHLRAVQTDLVGCMRSLGHSSPNLLAVWNLPGTTTLKDNASVNLAAPVDGSSS